MKRFLSHPSRIVAAIASALTLVASITLIPLPAQAAEVVSSSGSCVANVDNTSGVTVYDDGTYCYVAFKTTGVTYNWTRPGGVTSFDFVIVAGGGGGATRHAGGGGAGGMIQESAVSVTAATMSIVVGAGGAGATARSDGNPGAGSNGNNSTLTATGITTRTAIGGGAGQGSAVGSNGGSGGGNGCCVGAASVSSGTTGQGNSGGAGAYSASYWLGGGGGGAGASATAANGSILKAGIGGAGSSVSWINSTVQSALSVGVYTSGATYFAGGGGGGTAGTSTSGGEGGIGGGGAGATLAATPGAGTANTGGGGGASGIETNNSTQAGGAGGSGVAVFRYAKQTPVLSWNASDINSYESATSATAINDLSSASNLDGTLYSGSNAVAPGFANSTGAWTFSGGATVSGPYAKVNTGISTTSFATHGMTVDFEADFGAAADNWERILDFSTNADAANNLLIARQGATNNLAIELYNGAATQGTCLYTNSIPVNGGMNRWTVSLDGTNCRVYKNNALVYTVAFTPKPITGLTWTNNFIAKSNWSADNSFEGSIRSVRIFTGGLSSTEIPAPSNKTVTFNAYDGNTQNGGGVTNNMSSPRLTSGTVRLPTPITRAGYTFVGWFDATTFANKVGDAGGTYTPTGTITLYGGWRTSIDSTALSSLVFNFDATHIDSLPVAATTSASIYPASSRRVTSSVSGITRDTANSPGAALLPNGTGANYLNYGSNNETNISGAITFETWIKCSAYNSGAAWNVIASKWFNTAGATGIQDWHFGIYNDKLQVNTSTGSNNNVSTGSKTWSSADCGKWYLVGFTLDAAGNLQIYINGRADGALQTGKAHATNSSSEFWIGDARANSVRFQGYISRVRLYNAALTSTQMLNNFGGEATTYGMGPYTLTYKAGPNGSGADVVETYNAGTSVTLKNNNAPFTRAGYYISGWTNSSTSGAAQTNALTSSYTMDVNTVLYPVWTLTTYTITYVNNGATGAYGASSTYTPGGAAITLPSPVKTSYTFAGWWTTATFDTGTQVTGAQTPSSDMTLYAKWTLLQYTFTFKANNGTATADVVQTVTADVLTSLTLNTFTKAHSSFSRWSDVSTGLSVNTWSNGASLFPSSNMTYYAIWNDDAHIIFNSEGGSAVADAYTIGLPLAGATPLAKPTNPTKSGKIFGGWSTTESGGNGVVTNVVSWPRDYEVNATETLYAIWLDECTPTKTTFTATGTTDLTSATYGTNGVRYMQYRINSTTQCALSVPSKVSAFDVLMVAGGGAGSYYNRAGGGGAGTLLHTNVGGMSVTAGDVIPVKVGEGGTVTYVGAVDGNRGSNGGFTTFGNYRITGGGAGAGGYGTVLSAQPGGSGGGGACATGYGSGGAGGIPIYNGWTGYSNSGGNATYADCTQSGASGGGGAGGYPGNATATGGASLTRFGVELAGGGAGWWPGATRQGGGNVGGDWTNTCPASPSGANDGVANTGSGGGSCGNGAAGTVIVRFVAPTYSVNYTYNSATGGNSVTSSNFVMGDSALSLPTPTKTGYTFAGWYAEAGLTTLVGNAGASYTPTSDTTLYAKWTGGTYTLTYNYNGATGGNSTVSSSFTTGGSAITLPTPTKTNYTFGGWYAEAGLTTLVSGAQSPTADATLYAKWNGVTYTLTYNYNGATGGNSTTSSAYVTGGTAVTLPIPTRTNYTFSGWFSDAGLTTQVTGAQTPSADVTLYAKWAGLTYTLTYNYNGATGGNSTVSSAYLTGGTAITLPTPTKNNFTFAGWYSDVGLTNQVVGAQTPTADATLYAKWSTSAYAITFSQNYGIQANSTTNVAVGSATTLPTPTRSNFVFDGWWSASTGGSKIGNGGATFTPSSATTLYARWIQSSLYGVVNNLNRISTITASDLVTSSYSGSTGSSGVSVTLPNATLPAGTVVALDLITDTTYAQSLLTGTNNYILSIAVSWLAPDETVPDTNSGKSISMTITNSTIRAGALVYSVQNGVVTLLGTATQNGTITVQLTSDPSVYVVATVPSVPSSITSTHSGTTAVVTWSAPNTDGGSAITGYTVTLSSGATCTTQLLTCTFSNLTAGTSYTVTVLASNSIGNSVTGTTTFTLAGQQSSGSAPVIPAPPIVVPPTPVPPLPPVPTAPVLVKIPLVQAVQKVLAHNVPILTGTPLISPILFAPNSAKLDAADIKQIAQAAALLKDKSGWLFVTGFVKYEGKGTAIEKKIANARATAVAKELATLGLKVKIGYLGYGPQNKKAPKPTDRKVELRWLAESSQNS